MEETTPKFPRYVFKKGTAKPGENEGHFTAEMQLVLDEREMASLEWDHCDSPAAAGASSAPAKKTILSDALKTEPPPSIPHVLPTKKVK